MKYLLEIYYRSDCIEQRTYTEPFIAPGRDDRIYVDFQNPYYAEEYGHWWIVRERKHLLFGVENTPPMQTVQLLCEPDPQQGA